MTEARRAGPRGSRVSFKIGVKREATLGRKFLFIDTTRLSTLQPRRLKDGGGSSASVFLRSRCAILGFPRDSPPYGSIIRIIYCSYFADVKWIHGEWILIVFII